MVTSYNCEVDVLFSGCLNLPENAQVVEDANDKTLGYECVSGYELTDDGKCEDIDECEWAETVSLRWTINS